MTSSTSTLPRRAQLPYRRFPTAVEEPGNDDSTTTTDNDSETNYETADDFSDDDTMETFVNLYTKSTPNLHGPTSTPFPPLPPPPLPSTLRASCPPPPRRLTRPGIPPPKLPPLPHVPLPLIPPIANKDLPPVPPASRSPSPSSSSGTCTDKRPSVDINESYRHYRDTPAGRATRARTASSLGSASSTFSLTPPPPPPGHVYLTSTEIIRAKGPELHIPYHVKEKCWAVIEGTKAAKKKVKTITRQASQEVIGSAKDALSDVRYYAAKVIPAFNDPYQWAHLRTSSGAPSSSSPYSSTLSTGAVPLRTMPKPPTSGKQRIRKLSNSLGNAALKAISRINSRGNLREMASPAAP
ncbi:hypothetical protein EXIGLDRAFT_791743 [Exidia glandulosa HHB12029]|uniref:Uncharacterized protein n=1 Tax=Exidia glandulosa HHB12029 TaxID=1314781 RepID=A0A165HCQ9_EXIGL|nr:hypothetical protein EXIGLDRAFT_791743 [Exidia glandulosa HHB12029]